MPTCEEREREIEREREKDAYSAPSTSLSLISHIEATACIPGNWKWLKMFRPSFLSIYLSFFLAFGSFKMLLIMYTCTLLLLFLCQAFSQGYVYSRNIQTFGNHSLLRIQTHPKSHTGKTKAFNHDHLMMSCLMFMTLCSHQSYFMG